MFRSAITIPVIAPIPKINATTASGSVESLVSGRALLPAAALSIPSCELSVLGTVAVVSIAPQTEHFPSM